MSCLRGFDGFARPIQFTYKTEEEFTTLTGGIVTVLTTIMFIFYGGQQIAYLLLKPDFDEQAIVDFRDFNDS